MKIAVLTTHTNDTPLLYEPLAGLGHETQIHVYSQMTPAMHNELPRLVEAAKPDMVVFIGAVEVANCMPVPALSVLASIGSHCPLVHICCDGADPPWWPQVERYRA